MFVEKYLQLLGRIVISTEMILSYYAGIDCSMGTREPGPRFITGARFLRVFTCFF
jgi:hypothetical protein